jgi:ABC-2 type transport system ATP-binding protein
MDGGTTDAGGSVLRAADIRKTFGDWTALRGVSFDVRRGELVACIGPNGAGKTTLLSILAGIQPADGGTIEIPAGGRSVGWVPQQPALYGRLTVAENLRLFARLEGVDDVEGTVDRMLEQTDLAGRADERAANLSGGNQQRLNIAAGLVSSPALLLLDEPTASLDPRQRERLWEFIVELAADGTSVVYSTHVVSEAERFAARVLVLADGERLFWGSPNELASAVPAPVHGGFPDLEAAFVAFLHERGH